MDKFDEEYQRNLSNWGGNAVAAIYDTFKPQIENRGLSTDVEYVQPPNDFGIVGGAASESEAIIVIYIEAQRSEKIPSEEIEQAVTGIEGFLVDAGQSSSSIQKEEDKSIRTLRDQFSKLPSSISEMKRLLDVIVFTKGKVSTPIRKKCRKVNGIRVEIIDIDDWLETSEAIGSEINFSEIGGMPSVSLAASIEDHDLYMGVIPGITLAKLFDHMGNKLLESNVRMFLGDRGVNRGISETIEESPLRFAAYNNGITMVSSDVVIEDDHKVASANSISIVNGGQTTVSLFRCYRRQVDISEINVPLKLVVIKTDDELRKKGLLDSISRFSNTQNKVNNADRLAMEPPHMELQESSRDSKFFVDGKGWFYERRRGEVTTLNISDPLLHAQFSSRFPKENVMDSTVLAKMWNSWLGMPEVGASGKTKAFQTYHTQLQLMMHKTNWSPDSHHSNSVALWLMYKHMYYYIGKNYSALRGASLPHVIGWFSHLTDGRLDLSHIQRKGKLTPAVERCLESLVEPVDSLIRNYHEGDQKEWAKKVECTNEIREMDPPSDYGEESENLILGSETERLRKEDVLPYLHKWGKDKIWDAFRYAKYRGVEVNGKYLMNSMHRGKHQWPDLSPGGAHVVLEIWERAVQAKYLEKYPGAEDFFAPDKVKK